MACCNHARALLSPANFTTFSSEKTLKFSQIAPNFTRQKLLPYTLIKYAPRLSSTTTRAVVSVPKNYNSNNNDSATLNLNEELQSLISLRSRIESATSLDRKIQILDEHPRVKSLFGQRKLDALFGKVILDLRKVFLLKCLVAIGQEHVLGFDDGSVCEVSEIKSSNFLKDAFYVLAGCIESWGKHDNAVSNGPGSIEIPGNDNGGLKSEFSGALEGLLDVLEDVENFYDSIGGIVGYQVSVLQHILDSKRTLDTSKQSYHNKEELVTEFYVPRGIDLNIDKEFAAQAAMWGIEALPKLGEIYPLGGSGDRLGLVDKDTGESLPVAMLPYCGRTLLEGLIRDLQAREFLYFKLYGKQTVTPVAIMTSSAKDNNGHIMRLCEQNKWFGRGKRTFNIFKQPLVPTVSAENAQWLTSGPFSLVLKPGGHGAIWKLASDKGIYDWFYRHGRKAATVRQISNPVASTDITLFALSGIGIHYGKKLGFASCQCKVGATEGVNVLAEHKTSDGSWHYGITCIEYTEFGKLGIADAPISPESTQAQYPANTNVLFVDLPSAEQIGSTKTEASLPGMILNLKKRINYEDYLGKKHSLYAGRIECTMQNIADSLLTPFPQRRYSRAQDSFDLLNSLDTFIIYNERRKVTSSAKRERKILDKSLHQTPDGSFLDVMRNAYDLLVECSIEIPQVEDNSHYIHSRPPFLIFLHPALGPLWEISRQKFHGGSINKGSELQLEIAEFFWENVELDGSLIILSENVMGSTKTVENEDIVLNYGDRCGRCRLQNVKILNEGVDWSCSDNIYWQHKVHRFQSLKVIIQGNGEFEAHDVVLEGGHTFEVPDGYRMHVTSGETGLCCKMQPIRNDITTCGSWHWDYFIQNNHVHLKMVES